MPNEQWGPLVNGQPRYERTPLGTTYDRQNHSLTCPECETERPIQKSEAFARLTCTCGTLLQP